MGIMDENLFIKIIDDFSKISRANHFRGHVLFCNMGELFVHPNIALDRMKYVINSGLDFDIQTNAALLFPNVIEQLKDSGFNRSILISFHGISPNVYSQIMGLEVSKTLNNIDYLSHHYPKDKILIQSIPFHWPKGEAKHIRSYFHNKGIKVRMPFT